MLGDRINAARVIGALAPGGMYRRRDERHPRDYLRLRFEVFGQQTRVGKSFGEVEEDCGDLSQRAAVDQHERHLALGVEREKGGSAVFFLRQGNRTAFEW